MKRERIEDLLEEVEVYVDHVANDYVEGIYDQFDVTNRIHVKSEYLLEAIRLDLDMPSGHDIPEFFGYIADEAMDRVAKILENNGYEIRWWAGEFDVYSEKEIKED